MAVVSVAGVRGGSLVADSANDVWFSRYVTAAPGTQQWFYVGRCPAIPTSGKLPIVGEKDPRAPEAGDQIDV